MRSSSLQLRSHTLASRCVQVHGNLARLLAVAKEDDLNSQVVTVNR